MLLGKDLRINLTLASLKKFSRLFQIDTRRETAALDDAVRDFDIRTGRKDLLAGQLSGGNQQKLLLAKMMLLDPSIVIIDEPTRGIDIGTKEQIYRFIARLADEGRSIIVVSSEMPELIGICDRILVMRSGRIVGEVAGERMTEKRHRGACDGRSHAGSRLRSEPFGKGLTKRQLRGKMTEAALDSGKTPKTSKDWDLRAVAPFVALACFWFLAPLPTRISSASTIC